MTTKDSAEGLLRASFEYSAHMPSCDRAANGINGDCQCGFLLYQERLTAFLSQSGDVMESLADWHETISRSEK